MRWMRRRGDRVMITSGKYAGWTGTIEANVYQKVADYPNQWARIVNAGDICWEIQSRSLALHGSIRGYRRATLRSPHSR
jgi:hypothetical protein